MELKRTTKLDGKLKGVHIVEHKLVDEEGVVVDLIDMFKKAYGETPFDLSTTTKTEEIIDLEDEEEVDIEDLQ